MKFTTKLSTNGPPNLLSLHAHPQIYITIITFLYLATLILCVNPEFEACAPQSCGDGPIIKYPFWTPRKQPSFCGHPHFEIICNHKMAILRISNHDFVVQSLSNSNTSLVVANKAVYEQKCPTPLYDYSFIRTPFISSFENSNMSFFYNCTKEPIDYPTYEVDCVKQSTLHSFAVFHKEALNHQYYFHECQFMTDVLVYVHGISNFTSLLRMNYTEILKMGFILKWTIPEPDDCQLCEKSGGRCGFDNDKFLCFCKDKTHSKSCGDEKISLTNKAIVASVACLLTAIVILGGCYIYRRRKRSSYAKSIIQSSQATSSDFSSKMQDSELGSKSYVVGVHVFTYTELEEATDHFNAAKELGDGGFGTVYFGKLQDGRCVAVKRLYENNYKRVEQFMNEVEILSTLRHQNLVSLYGCTSRHSRELLLVYEYIPNGTVADHLHGERAKPGSLPWSTRMNIAIETASALVYLHAKDIIHRDVKTNNILLDNHFCVKVADFGLSRLFPEHVTHISTAPQGTPGYVDPEYHECYQLTHKSDVYSFGVVLIELISSMPAVDITRHRHEINLSTMAINKIQNRALHELVDPTLGFERDYKVRKMINGVAELAFQCLQSMKDLRPSMEEVLDVLRDLESDGKLKEGKAEVMDISADDVGLLKNDMAPPLPSPDSKMGSKSTTPNTSN